MDASLNAAGLVARLRGTFDTGRTRDIAWRREQLEALRRLLREGEGRLIAAIAADFSKPAVRDADHRNPQRGLGNRSRPAAACALDARASRQHPMGAVARLRPRPAGAARRRADHRAVELSGAAPALAAGRRPRGGQLRGAQAERTDTAHIRGARRAGAAIHGPRRDRARGGRCAMLDGAARGTLRPHLLHRRCPRSAAS